MALSPSMSEVPFTQPRLAMLTRVKAEKALTFRAGFEPFRLPQARLSPTAIQPAVEWFDPNTVQYDFNAIYSPDGKLTTGQRICDFLIRQVYQRPTRNTVYKWLGNPCPFKHFAKKLGCSEYALVMIHRFGVVRGIYLGAIRLLRCNPVTAMMGSLNDPLIRVN